MAWFSFGKSELEKEIDKNAASLRKAGIPALDLKCVHESKKCLLLSGDVDFALYERIDGVITTYRVRLDDSINNYVEDCLSKKGLDEEMYNTALNLARGLVRQLIGQDGDSKTSHTEEKKNKNDEAAWLEDPKRVNNNNYRRDFIKKTEQFRIGSILSELESLGIHLEWTADISVRTITYKQKK